MPLHGCDSQHGQADPAQTTREHQGRHSGIEASAPVLVASEEQKEEGNETHHGEQPMRNRPRSGGVRPCPEGELRSQTRADPQAQQGCRQAKGRAAQEAGRDARAFLQGRAHGQSAQHPVQQGEAPSCDHPGVEPVGQERMETALEKVCDQQEPEGEMDRCEGDPPVL